MNAYCIKHIKIVFHYFECERKVLQRYNTPRAHEAYCNVEELVLVGDAELMTC
jgi:hypothetical protein